MSEIKLVVFDMAGTTVRDVGQVSSAFTDALAEHQIEFTPEQLSRVRGASKRQAVLNFIPDGPDRARRAGEVYTSFRKRLVQRYEIDGIEPLDGAERTLHLLRAQGIRVALNTGFDRDITDLLLKALRWEHGMVDAVVCGDDVRQGRPAPYLIFRAMEQTGTISTKAVINVGDTVKDLEAGWNAGVHWNVAVLSGAHDRQTLEASPHTHILRSVADLPAALADEKTNG